MPTSSLFCFFPTLTLVFEFANFHLVVPVLLLFASFGCARTNTARSIRTPKCLVDLGFSPILTAGFCCCCNVLVTDPLPIDKRWSSTSFRQLAHCVYIYSIYIRNSWDVDEQKRLDLLYVVMPVELCTRCARRASGVVVGSDSMRPMSTEWISGTCHPYISNV